MKLCCSVWQATSTEAWIYRNNSTREAIVSFRGTSDPKDMMTDAAMSLAAFSPGQRPDSRSPEDVANSLSDEELENGPLGGIFKGIKVTWPVLTLRLLERIKTLQPVSTVSASGPVRCCQAAMDCLFNQVCELPCRKVQRRALEARAQELLHNMLLRGYQDLVLYHMSWTCTCRA